MSLRALPKDLCTSSYRQVPRPPLPSGAGGTGSKKKFPRPSMPYGISASLAVAQRQIRQKRRLHHWRHAHQLSLCIRETDFLPAQQPGGVPVTLSENAAALATAMRTLVDRRAQLADQLDPIGVLHANTRMLFLVKHVKNHSD